MFTFLFAFSLPQLGKPVLNDNNFFDFMYVILKKYVNKNRVEPVFTMHSPIVHSRPQSTYFPRDETGLVCLPTQLERTLQLYW
jgi:hypothetical protein